MPIPDHIAKTPGTGETSKMGGALEQRDVMAVLG
jgi:hypothetical protein